MNASRWATGCRHDSHPATRPSLLDRLQHPRDDESWKQFFELYVPVIFGVARRKGLQDADAWEVTQEVLIQLTRSLPEFHYDPDRGRFRAWLSRVIHSRLVRHWNRQARRHRTFEQRSELGDLPEACVDPLLDEVLVQHLTQRALDRIRDRFQPETWQAFLLTWRDQIPADQVAQTLNRPIGWVYVCKSRVLKRLGMELQELAETCLP